MDSETPKQKLAFLGPRGTYSHQAAHERFGDFAEYVPKLTIREAYEALGGETTLALLPAENSTYGPVTETLDLFAQTEADPLAPRPVVRGEVTLAVRHCLLVRRGISLGEIKRVLSHEQALGQCSSFLARELPRAVLVKTASTAGAAEALEEGDAAIGSAVCAVAFERLEILREGIQNSGENTTRFMVISRTYKDPLPPDHAPQPGCHALLQVYAGSIPISQLLNALHLDVTQIDRRPYGEGKLFAGVYIVRVRREREASRDFTEDISLWKTEVRAALDQVIQAGGQGVLLGAW